MNCPSCGGVLSVKPSPEKRDQVKAMVAVGSKADYASAFVDNQVEKQETLGVVHTCAACRYVTRVPRIAMPAGGYARP